MGTFAEISVELERGGGKRASQNKRSRKPSQCRLKEKEQGKDKDIRDWVHRC